MNSTVRSLAAAIVSASVLVTTASCEPDTLTTEQRRLNQESFDTIWQTINDNHFDTTFGGVDTHDG